MLQFVRYTKSASENWRICDGDLMNENRKSVRMRNFANLTPIKEIHCDPLVKFFECMLLYQKYGSRIISGFALEGGLIDFVRWIVA